MLDQIIELHAGLITTMHIGCDEVSQLGVCAACCQKMAIRGWSKHRLYAEHVCRVANYCKSE